MNQRKMICAGILDCPAVAIEADLYRLAEWETAQQLRDAVIITTDYMFTWYRDELLWTLWLAAEEVRIFGKAGA